MDTSTRLEIEQQCSKLINLFARYNDAMDYARLVQLFTANGEFARPTAPDSFISGREAIREGFESRAGDRVTRHLMTNTTIEVLDEEHARGHSYALLYTGNAKGPEGKMGLLADDTQFLGEIYTEFAREGGEWLISRYTGKIIFSTT